MRSNLKYGKNQKREDVKSHHYIISFDPRDAQDNGLTVDRAQQLGEQFCKEQFPGHQALVYTHKGTIIENTVRLLSLSTNGKDVIAELFVVNNDASYQLYKSLH